MGTRGFTLAILGAILATGCSGSTGSSFCPAAGCTAPLRASPSNIQFGLNFIPPPQLVTVSSAANIGSLSLSVADPTVVGVSAPSISGATASFSVFAIAHGSTTVTANDRAGASASVTAATAACGRRHNLLPSSQLVYPKPGTTMVPVSIGKLYFGVVSQVSPSGNLHLIVAQHQTLEGGSLRVATPPPGSATVSPPSHGILTYMSAVVPTLAPGVTYRTQVYDDACQLPILPGTFST